MGVRKKAEHLFNYSFGKDAEWTITPRVVLLSFYDPNLDPSPEFLQLSRSIFCQNIGVLLYVVSNQLNFLNILKMDRYYRQNEFLKNLFRRHCPLPKNTGRYDAIWSMRRRNTQMIKLITFSKFSKIMLKNWTVFERIA